MQVAYHVTTKMPNHPTDEQQTEKKRHVGNDFVQIVWNNSMCGTAGAQLLAHTCSVRLGGCSHGGCWGWSGSCNELTTNDVRPYKHITLQA